MKLLNLHTGYLLPFNVYFYYGFLILFVQKYMLLSVSFSGSVCYIAYLLRNRSSNANRHIKLLMHF